MTGVGALERAVSHLEAVATATCEAHRLGLDVGPAIDPTGQAFARALGGCYRAVFPPRLLQGWSNDFGEAGALMSRLSDASSPRVWTDITTVFTNLAHAMPDRVPTGEAGGRIPALLPACVPIDRVAATADTDTFRRLGHASGAVRRSIAAASQIANLGAAIGVVAE